MVEDGDRIIMEGSRLYIYDRNNKLLLKVERSSNRLYKATLKIAKSSCLLTSQRWRLKVARDVVFQGNEGWDWTKGKGEQNSSSGKFNFKLKEYVKIPNDSGITFNVQPKMKALEIGEKARDAILSGKFDHAADEAIKMNLDAVEQVGGIYVVTVEDIVKENKNGEPFLDKDGNVQILTSHTLQSVPVAIGGSGLAAGVEFRSDVPSEGLVNIAATTMNLYGLVTPEDYETTQVKFIEMRNMIGVIEVDSAYGGER